MSHINPDKRFVGQTETADLASLPWLHIYEQPCEHFEAYIIGNRKTLRILMDTIEDALDYMPLDPDNYNEVMTKEEVFATDGEGYSVRVILLPDSPEKKPMVDNLWDRYPPPYHRD
jgi:hypothetical protein